MRRRDLIALLGGAWPLFARAEQPAKTYRIAYLTIRSATDPEEQRRFDALVEGLEHLGWSDGRNVRIDRRWAGGDAGQARRLAKELVGLAPDVIVVGTSPALAAVRAETRTLPVVFAAVADPVDQGFVAGRAHPGGNITGFSDLDPALGSKWLELLKEVAPGTARVAFLFSPETSSFNRFVLRAIEAAGRSYAVSVTGALVNDAAEIETAIAALAHMPNGGLIVPPAAWTEPQRDRIIQLAARHRLPAVHGLRSYAMSGGLISYSPDSVEEYRMAAGYVDRVLKGARPGDLPVQAPTKFEFVVNLKTARALGLTVPQLLLAQADEVIE